MHALQVCAVTLPYSKPLNTRLLGQTLGCHADQASLQDVDGRLQQPAVSDLLVLDHLAASWGCTGVGGGNSSSSDAGSGSSLALASARRFVCCRMLHDALLAASQEGGGEEEVDPKVVTLLLVQHRNLQDSQLPLLGERPSCYSGLRLGLCAHATCQRPHLHGFKCTLPDCCFTRHGRPCPLSHHAPAVPCCALTPPPPRCWLRPASKPRPGGRLAAAVGDEQVAGGCPCGPHQVAAGGWQQAGGGRQPSNSKFLVGRHHSV
jgi:hypothetical protein